MSVVYGLFVTLVLMGCCRPCPLSSHASSCCRVLNPQGLSPAGLWIDMNEPSNFATDLCGAAGAALCGHHSPAFQLHAAMQT